VLKRGVPKAFSYTGEIQCPVLTVTLKNTLCVKAILKAMSTNSLVQHQLQSATSSVNGVGYSGMGYSTSGIKMVALAKKAGQPFVEATPANAINGSYPLARYLFVYVNKKPNQPLAPLESEFMKMVLSKTGQQVVIKDGYIPLPAKVVEKILAKLK